MTNDRCLLCHAQADLLRSHVLPAFVFRAIKSDSPTGYFRMRNSANRRRQDGDKVQMLCRNCEALFSSWEREFAQAVFLPFHIHDVTEFEYGNWLHKFACSVTWRTLVLDLDEIRNDPNFQEQTVSELHAAEATQRAYLKGADWLADSIRIHIFPFEGAIACSPELVGVGVNVKLRRSVFGWTVALYREGYSGVIINLAGFFIFLIIKGNPRDNWVNTKVSPKGGIFDKVCKIDSWLFGDVMDVIVEMKHQMKNLSPKQKETTAKAIAKNHDARGLRFRTMDRRIIPRDE